ncbi:MAG: hypothetical protein RJA52_792 [Bacteroidota bacterium]|jgi:hypothetical protein
MYLIGLIPLILALVVLLKDARKKRRFVLNILILGNLIFFYSPLILALFNTPYGESMWNENSGGGAYFWLYYWVIPIYIPVQLILTILRLVFWAKS